MSYSEEEPGGTTDPTWGKETMARESLKMCSLEEQPGGANEHVGIKGALGPEDLSPSVEMPLPGGGSVKQSAARSQLREEQPGGPEEDHRSKRPRSPVPSVMSMSSNRSKDIPLNFKGQEKATDESAAQVLCDVCPNPAVKTCVTCMDSYCMSCIRPHYNDPDLEEHQLQDLQLHGHDVIGQDPQGTHLATSHHSSSSNKEYVPPPGQIQFSSVTPDSVTVSWSPPECAAGPHRYRVTWRRGPDQRSATVEWLKVEMTGLLPGEKYHFTVATLGEEGCQSKCVKGSVQTEIPAPENIRVDLQTTPASVKWTKPAGVNKVSYLLDLFKEGECLNTVHTNCVEFVLSDLQLDTDYTIRVSTVHERHGQSKPISVSFAKTADMETSSNVIATSDAPKTSDHNETGLGDKESEPTAGESRSKDLEHEGTSTDEPEHASSSLRNTKQYNDGKMNTQLLQYEAEDIDYGTPSMDIINLFTRLDLRKRILTSDVLDITSIPHKISERELKNFFLDNLFTANYSARHTSVREATPLLDSTNRMDDENNDVPDVFSALFKKMNVPSVSKPAQIHPMDVQMAVFHCADHFLKQLIVTKLSQCQYALPLLVPNPFTHKIEFPLWTFHQIKKSWKMTNTKGEVISISQSVCKAETPMVAFFRLGSVSSSKSQLMNSLINEKHNTFFHRNCPGSSRTRLLMDGVVEIAWYCPSGRRDDKFTDCVAFCNLHGDAGTNHAQRGIVVDMATINVVLLPDLNKEDCNMAILKELCQSPKPLICVGTEDEDPFTKIVKGKYNLGLKNRNWADVSAELINVIRQNLSEQSSGFRLGNVSHYQGIKVDTESKDCRRGLDAAVEIVKLLEGKDPSAVKDTFLPCQGKLWHDWSQKNKELHRITGENIEIAQSNKREEMRTIRQKQKATGSSELLQLFIETLKSLSVTEKQYFLRWINSKLDDFTSEKLCVLYQEYDKTWGRVMDLKKIHDKSEQLEITQRKLEESSAGLIAATFGLEHIFREMGQIYESFCEKDKAGRQDKHVPDLPKLAAELMISGHPMELMDGDAAHVPLIWVPAVLDELIKKVGDQRVFVLSVLGIQSSGKSTMLNAMFGLQFAVSAGRCTRGAFMQLVRVSEEMKAELKFDYILVVDTEGLRALELAGKGTVCHDNELATFVVGLANMTLINIFGENPSEMQDILQIVAQAFLRMKKVRLNPSCIFVHQNVTDVTAGEKNMEGRRRLLEKLDEMTKLAAKEEVCDAECFSDVIAFDIQTDVKYCAHLWEGSPPMAPPNPRYSENIQELKTTILLHASKSDGMMLSGLKTRVQDLWEALLNENFVFSFRNSLEIMTYRKLETEYGKWTWKIRSAMLEIGNRLHNLIESGELHEVGEPELHTELQGTNKEVEISVAEFFEKDKYRDILIQWRGSFEIKIKELQNNIVKETKMKLEELLKQREVNKMIDDQIEQHEEVLFERSKDLAFRLKAEANDEETLKREFDSVWSEWVDEIKRKAPPVKNIDISKDVIQILGEVNKGASLDQTENNIFLLANYSDYVTARVFRTMTTGIGGIVKQTPPLEDLDQIRNLVNDIEEKTDNMIKSKPVAKMGYNISYIQELTDYINSRVKEHEKERAMFKKEFTMDLSLRVCDKANTIFTELHQTFIKNNDPIFYVQNKKEEFYCIFQKYCQGSSSAAILGVIVCQKLKEPILRSVYKDTAIKLANQLRNSHASLSGNRANQEKHILRSLANKECFNSYLIYIHKYKDNVKYFVKDQVSGYIHEHFRENVLPMLDEQIDLKHKSIIDAARNSTKKIKATKGDVRGWLQHFTQSLSEQMAVSEMVFREVSLDETDNSDLIEEVMLEEIPNIISDIRNTFSTDTFLEMLDYSDQPDEVLMKHFEQYCWEQCPFCGAPCTNTVGGHAEDHMVPIHRNTGMKGVAYMDTTNLSISVCTSAVTSDLHFYPSHARSKRIPWNNYRTAGGKYATWNITPDLSVLPYWKWFVCTFQEDLEKFYKKTFEGSGEIPDEWRKYTKEDALESLDHYF